MPAKKFMKKNIPPKEQRSLVCKNDETEYGLVTKKLGNGRFSIRLNMQNREVIGRLCGKFRHGPSKKNNWVDVDTVVLVGLRDFQDDTVDIVHVYDSTEVRQLRKSGELLDESVHPTENDSSKQFEEALFDFDEI